MTDDLTMIIRIFICIYGSIRFMHHCRSLQSTQRSLQGSIIPPFIVCGRV